VKLAEELVPMLLTQDRAYGMAISIREVEDFEHADLEDLAAAFVEELE
jgi:hypothetical protein